MKRKGFTLVELLAVIVILAIIALIATPIIFNVIEDARMGAAKSSATGYVKAIENKIATSALSNTIYEDKEDYVFDEIEVEIKGTKPTGGIYSLKKGIVVSAVFCINGYEVSYVDNKTEINGKCTGEELKLNGNVKLSEINGNYTYPNTGTFEVIENLSGGTLSCESSNKDIADCSISGTTVTVTSGIKEGETTLTIKSLSNSKYKEAEALYKVQTTSGTLEVSAEGWTGSYDGNPHGITVISSGGTIKYGTSSGTYTLTSSPTYIEPGIYNIYYEVSEPGYKTVTGSKSVSITNISAFKINSVDPMISGLTINYEIPNMESMIQNVTCEYGKDDTYGNKVTCTNGKCEISRLDSNEKYYYKVCVTDKANNNKCEQGEINTNIDIFNYENRNDNIIGSIYKAGLTTSYSALDSVEKWTYVNDQGYLNLECAYIDTSLYAYSSNMIDVTNLKTLRYTVELERNCPGTEFSGELYFGLSDNKDQLDYNFNVSSQINLPKNELKLDKRVIDIDVSGINGNMYLKFITHHGNEVGECTIFGRLYNIEGIYK